MKCPCGTSKMEFCMTRRAVFFLCLDRQSITKSVIEKSLGCSKIMINTIIQNLVDDDFIKPQANTNSYNVEHSNLNNYGIQKYFPSTENNDNEEPIGETLEEMESLQEQAITMIENSIKRVDLNLHDVSPNVMTHKSLKRKASSEVVNLDDSENLFQTSKRPRIKRRAKRI
ncbi:HORMA domain-containing protein 1 [Caerostris extrusa]|uniref:HORMA domain-containing protein 1 n=1 Tax=Caerostris extrusa TaxID=172846 RepID=A0AAV4N914_CAEEX|nr:HORMA domain-containing protein 1 [Caerostris extrusa]